VIEVTKCEVVGEVLLVEYRGENTTGKHAIALEEISALLMMEALCGTIHSMCGTCGTIHSMKLSSGEVVHFTEWFVVAFKNSNTTDVLPVELFDRVQAAWLASSSRRATITRSL
jgi:hypothetical protein